MATSKALRAAPPKILDNYVTSIKRLYGGPDTVPDELFLTKGTILIPGSAAGAGNSVLTTPIGFNVELNGKTYKEFSVSDAGWMFLRDPAGGSTGMGGGSWFYYDVIYNPAAPPNQAIETSNEFILPNFSYDHILLAPWFGTDLTQLATTVDQIEIAYSLTSADKENIAQGGDTRKFPYNLVDNGVRCLNGVDSEKGRYLLVRWSMASNYYTYKFKFEVAIYENGLIEYRYWPLETLAPSSASTPLIEVTVGGFWSGPSTGANKFRDFSTLLDYRKIDRSISSLGGAVYDTSFTEAKTSAYRSAPYAVKVSATNWPKNGAVITLAPPVNPAKFLPKKLTPIISSNKEIVRSPGLFDDRRSISFKTGSLINLPSNLPSRLFGDTGDMNVSIQQLLFTSGSIVVTGSVNKVVFDSQLQQLEALDNLKQSADFSFNEAQKNYDSTSKVTEFYATGSSISFFGEGFTAPLKSKTQFQISLPVTKQTTLPSLTSSIYYYDSSFSQWMKKASEFSNNIKTKTLTSNYVEGDYDDYYTYRVTETAIGFDAVGRKVVSGTIPASFQSTSRQSDISIGGIFNAPYPSRLSTSGVEIAMDSIEKSVKSQSTAINKKYLNSITENSAFCPDVSQKFDLPIDYPFLIEKVIVEIPLYISGAWFNDITTCNKAFGDVGQAAGLTSGSIDFGGPGLTFSLMCGRENGSFCFLDLIASGTITHVNDNTGSVTLYKNSGMNNYVLRPVGFKAFSNPSTVISGTNNIFNSKVKLELEASIAGGLTLARNDRSVHPGAEGPSSFVSFISDNRNACINLLTSPLLPSEGGAAFNDYDAKVAYDTYANRAPRVYLQQVSPLPRGSTGFEFNGNSILGGNVAYFNLTPFVNNPLYYSSSGSLSAELKSKIDTADFTFEAISIYSFVNSRPAPYLVFPGDKLTIAFSKTRPVSYKMYGNNPFGVWDYTSYDLTGSHGTVMLNTGSIDITVYGSYVREGMEYHP